ncbi:MAG: ATP-binding cassette domain-containing protein, partial [Polyangiales bacterium]
LRKVFEVRERAAGLRAALHALYAPTRKEVVAVDEVSFHIERGERVAFVGPNGAGKSTTIKILCGILHPTAGSARVLGFVPWQEREALSYRVGTVFGQRSQLFYHLPAADTFELLRHVYDQDPLEFAARREVLIEAFGVGPHLNRPVRQLSLGERMRCELVASLLHAPDILLLDEPTIGLDVSAKAAIRALVREQAERHGRTLLLTSHDTADMEQVCERVIVIHHGRVIVDQSVQSLRSGYIRKKLLALETVEAELPFALEGVRVLRRAPHRLELEVDLRVSPVERVIAAVLQVGRVRDLTVTDPPMDEIVQAIYETAAPVTRNVEREPVEAVP